MAVTNPKTSSQGKVEVKLEGSQEEEVATEGETVTDIQNYLDSFNKEIQGGEPSTIQAAAAQNGAPEGTYFVDLSGNYCYQAGSTEDGAQVLTVVSGVADPNSGVGSVVTSEHQQYVTIQTSGENAGSGNSNEENMQLLSENGDAFQTVTIVPSETNPGEVSYVLIVQQRDDDKHDDKDDDEDQDLTVYDFDDGEEPGPVSAAESGDEDDKSKIIKLTPKKSQTVTQAHMCNYCNYTSPKRYLLSRHMKSHSEERPHKCSVCERGFKTLASLQNHVNTHTGTKPHRCKFCESAFTTSGELVRHVRYKHTYEKPHKCTICDYASVELSKMRNHMRCHTGERPYQCPHCTYASPDTFKLKRHLRIHTGEKPYECDICHARFTQSNSLKAHKLIHSAGDKPVFRCELCPATCGRKTDLRIHVQKLHMSDHPLKCKRCGKQFPDRYTFKVHNKSHEGEKCWKCELCPYASVSQRHLESHILIHTDQKPFQCEMCDQSFRQKQLLRRHQNLYHNPAYVPPPPKEKTHVCPDCKRMFRHKGNLIRHMSVHDPESAQSEKALALKLGRQKKIQIIDGQQVEVIPDDDEEEEEEDEEDEMDETGELSAGMGQQVMQVEGADGQQYVVLEVIQLQDSNGDPLAVMSQNNYESLQNMTADKHNMLEDTKVGQEVFLKIKAKEEATTAEDNMENCFGFDEEEDEDGVEMETEEVTTEQAEVIMP
ncbi:uncharacterized protein [Bemisia tabaci]|uniref:uncharacterized protein isoform X2 n=1 Tax=Bemisia tabaci TaxID=7038 RepID=UPI0008F9966B|nr:PREDICTED: transcriptional repressor CTCFL-like isoform X2 [Bemisia tabaci]